MKIIQFLTKNQFITRLPTLQISWFDFFAMLVVIVGGMFYLHDEVYWGVGYVGGAPYGDAEFWWNGALHVAEGIFKDNPGKGFRPGYFLLTGFTLPILGLQFKQFYPYFLFSFLMVSTLFYLALRLFLGRWVALGVLAILIFNPYTAEWLATSTTDATGLLFHLAALTALLVGVQKGLQNKWLILFGLLFSLASLTRPLMTPFVALVLLVILLYPQVPFKKRLIAVSCIFIAFCLPTFLWMAAQKLIINQWSLSSNDASAFYAASDPNLQVWNPQMYNHIRDLTLERYHVDPDERLLNRTFWIETVKNYIKYAHYHINRLVPHVTEIARFSPKRATHGADDWRHTFLLLIVIGIACRYLVERYWLSFLLYSTLFFLFYVYPASIVFATIGGVMCGLLVKPGDDHRLGILLLSLYWLTGVISLYFVGGTWGPPLGPQYDLNALGYRLGCQVFFVGDLLTAYFLVWLGFFKPNKSLSDRYVVGWPSLVNRSSPLAGNLVAISLVIFFSAVICVYIAGGTMVMQRFFARLQAPVKPYPSLQPVVDLYNKHFTKPLFLAESVKGGLDTPSLVKISGESGPDVIFTGTISPFIWNFEGQERAQLKVYSQKQISPYTMGPGSLIIEIPQHIAAADWIGAQGAFIIRQVFNQHNQSNLPYYLTTPEILGFIPLDADKKGFDLAKALWFPLVKNATQLDSSGELKASDNAKIVWTDDSGQAHYQRRFFITPKKVDKPAGQLELMLDVAKIHFPAILSFAYLGEGDVIGSTPRAYAIKIYSINKGSVNAKPILIRHETLISKGNSNQENLQKITLPIEANTQAVKIVFDQLAEGEGVWIYEFNLKMNSAFQSQNNVKGKLT